MRTQTIAFYILGLLLVSPAAATPVTIEAYGTCVTNDLGSGPLAGVPVGSAVTMLFDVDSEDYFDIDPGHNRRYTIINDSFLLTAGEGVIDGISGDNGINITNDYPVMDGFHWFQSNIGGGYWLEYELWGASGDIIDSVDVTEIAGTYTAGQFADRSWHINWAFIVSFSHMIINPALTSIPEPEDSPLIWGQLKNLY